jgi:serine/arginine repetitive matrix protein 1
MMTGFLGKTRARTFMGELWDMLVLAQESPLGVPAELIELKRSELIKKKVNFNAFLFLQCWFK